MVRTTAGGSVNPGVVSPGRIHYSGTLKEFLANAYDVKEFQIEGPAWMDTERFVVDATMPPETTRQQRLFMLQNLLIERFKLTSHREEKELPMYSLAMGKNGLKMKESPSPAQGTGAGERQPGAESSRSSVDVVTNVRTIAMGCCAIVMVEAMTMRELAQVLHDIGSFRLF